MKYSILTWKTNYDKEQGNSSLYSTNLNLKESLNIFKEIVDRGVAVVSEIQTQEDEPECVYTYDGYEENKPKLFLELCKNCIDDLKEYNPYVHADKKTPVSLDEMVLIEVSSEDCNNFESNLGIKNSIWKLV